jgi:hypothetical protein
MESVFALEIVEIEHGLQISDARHVGLLTVRQPKFRRVDVLLGTCRYCLKRQRAQRDNK